MKKFVVIIGFTLIIFHTFGQFGCVKYDIDYNIPKTGSVIFADSGESKVSIVIDENGHDFLYRKETTFSIYELYLVKSEKTTKYLLGMGAEGYSSYTLTFFQVPNYEKKFTINKEADLFQPQTRGDNNEYFLSKQLGCCEYADYYELSTFPENKKFLSYHKNRLECYARRSHPASSGYVIYFGYDMCSTYMDTTKMILGTLNYSINQEINGSVIFKKKNREDIIPYVPAKLQLMENGEPTESPIHFLEKSAFLYSNKLNYLKNYSEINNIGIIITFVLYKKDQSYEKDYKIEIVNGNIINKEIIVEF